MWNFVNTMGHPGHIGPFTNQKRDFSFHVQSVPIVPGKTFSNPNFVNKHHPSVHGFQNNIILTPIPKNSHNDSSNLSKTKPFESTGTLVNSSQSILDKVKENHIDVIKPIEPNPQEEPNPVMCNSRKRSKRNRRGRWSKTPNKNSKQNILRQQINDMDIDLDIEPSSTVTDISMSPNEPHCFALTDFIIEKPCKMKPIQIKVDQSRHDSDEEHLPSEIAISPFGKMYVRERQVSITESEDSFIVFDSGTDEELAFSEESGNESESENEEEDIDSSSSVIPHKRVRFAQDNELCEIHPMVQWSFAYQQARKGPWEEYARDRDRFGKRIAETERVLSPILDAKHRDTVYRERFVDKIIAS